jgi:single-strand DNA-binding protein
MDTQRQILIFGRLGKEPELKYTPKQIPVCNLDIAEDVVGQEKPNWHKVTVWGKQAELCKVMLKKGSTVFVRGLINVKEFTTKTGEIRKYEEMKASSVGVVMD